MTSLSSGYHLRGSQYSQGSAGLGRQMDGGQDKKWGEAETGWEIGCSRAGPARWDAAGPGEG